MVEFKWIQISLFLTAVLQFTAADKQSSSFTVRVGDDVTLPCENVIDSQEQCNGTTWVFNDLTNKASVELIKHGQISEEAKSKSDRLSVTEKCSLDIKKVTVEDAGVYTCQQYDKSGRKQSQDAQVFLSVVTMTEQKDTEEVTLTCSVRTYERCKHTVKWLFKNQEFDKYNQEVMTSQSSCSASVNLQTSRHIYASMFNSLKCEVTDGYNEQKFLFSVRPSGEKPGDDTKTTTTTTRTTKPAITESTTTRTKPTTRMSWVVSFQTKSATETSVISVTNTTAVNTSTKQHGWRRFIIVFVAVAALLIIVVVFIRWKRTKGAKTQMDENADPENGVAYASISFTKKTNRRARARGKDDEAVTYSTVKVSSSSAGASADPSCLYTTINKPNK